MKYLILLFPTIAFAGGWHHKHEVDVTVNREPQDINITIEQEPVQVDLTGLTGLSSVDTVNYTTGYNDCQGLAAAQAAASSQMYLGTNKPQISGAVGVCDGNYATDLRVGTKIRNNIFINGGWQYDELTSNHTGGVGMNWVWK
jgi:hypothetical protein